MDLLNPNYEEKQPKSKAKKIVTISLISCIVMAIIIVIIMAYILLTVETPLTLQVNGTNAEIKDGLIITDNAGNEYISLSDLSDLVNFTYYNGEYLKYEEDKTKCYINNGEQVVGFSVDSSVIYKVKEKSDTDYEYYNLNYNIITNQDKLYVAVNDLAKSLNIVYTKTAENQIIINTTQYLATTHTENLKQSNYELTTDIKNIKAIAYDMLVVKRNNTWSVLNSKYQEVIGEKYSTIEFDEYTMSYIVSNDKGQYGIITEAGKVKVPLQYDSLKIINYEPLLYEVSKNKKYGIMKSDGTLLTEIQYDGIGYKAEPQNKINYTLIIPDLDGKTGQTVVVFKDNRYGLIYLKDGQTFIECKDLEKIYEIEELGQINYKVEIQKQTFTLKEYIEYIKTQVVVVN